MQHYNQERLKKQFFLLLAFMVLMVISFSLVGCSKPVNPAENALYVTNDDVLSEDNIYVYNQGALYKALPEEGKLYVEDSPISVFKTQDENRVKIYIENLSSTVLEENLTYIYKNKTLSSIKFPEELIGHVYMNESEYYSKYHKNRTYLTGMPSGNYAPEPLKGEALNDYFKSLNLTEDYIYVMIQFETLGGDPTKDQIKVLEDDGITLFEYHGDHTYYAKIPTTVLETKSYDFVRWIGIVEKPEWKIQETNPIRDILYKNCTGMLNVRIEFYENISIRQLTTLREISKSCVIGNNEDCGSIINEDHIKLEVDTNTLINVSLLDFVKKISLAEFSAGLPGGPGSWSEPIEYNIYEHVNCTDNNITSNISQGNCITSNDCFMNQICINNTCAEVRCESDSDCSIAYACEAKMINCPMPNNYSCNSSQIYTICKKQCGKDSDCPGGECIGTPNRGSPDNLILLSVCDYEN